MFITIWQTFNSTMFALRSEIVKYWHASMGSQLWNKLWTQQMSRAKDSENWYNKKVVRYFTEMRLF